MKSGINEGGNIFNMQDGRWKAQYQIGKLPNGNRRFRTRTFATKKEAAKWIEQMRAEYAEPSPEAYTIIGTIEEIKALLESIANNVDKM